MTENEFEFIKRGMLAAIFRADDALCRTRDELEGTESGRGAHLCYINKQVAIASAAVQKVMEDLKALCDGSLTAQIIDAQIRFSKLA